MPSRTYLARFNFRGADQQKPVGQLSGGERGRLHLAKQLVSGANVLLLDEPSNDLDVETLRALEEALLEFAGSVLVISHDRWFLDRIATHILAFEGESQALFFAAKFAEYELPTRGSASAKRAPARHRIRQVVCNPRRAAVLPDRCWRRWCTPCRWSCGRRTSARRAILLRSVSSCGRTAPSRRQFPLTRCRLPPATRRR